MSEREAAMCFVISVLVLLSHSYESLSLTPILYQWRIKSGPIRNRYAVSQLLCVPTNSSVNDDTRCNRREGCAREIQYVNVRIFRIRSVKCDCAVLREEARVEI